MKKKNLKHNVTDDIVLTLKREEPRSVRELVKLVQERYGLPEKEIIKDILDLHNRGKLTLEDYSPTPVAFTAFILSRAYWYWAIVALTFATAFFVFTISENLFPIVYARYLLGSLYVAFLPGYSLIKALFPEKELDNIERIALSIAMSFALVLITGLLLNYTPWGIRTAPVTLSLLALTTTFATAAIIREHRVLAR